MVGIDRNTHTDWREFLSTVADRCGSLMICVTVGLVRTPQSQEATLGEDASQLVASITGN